MNQEMIIAQDKNTKLNKYGGHVTWIDHVTSYCACGEDGERGLEFADAILYRRRLQRDKYSSKLHPWIQRSHVVR